jgi:hypothetical protein
MSAANIFVGAAGLVTLLGALFDWDWFMEHRKARFFTEMLGRGGARVFYGVLGVVLVFVALTVQLK